MDSDTNIDSNDSNILNILAHKYFDALMFGYVKNFKNED
jgi:hypothetical protein